MGCVCRKFDPGDEGDKRDERAKRANRAKKDTVERKRQRRKVLAKQQHLATKENAADKIQAWWRGTLVRRTLLVAALRAWVIQVWWRALLLRQAQKLQQMLLKVYVVQEQAAVRLQSCIRMCQCHQRYCQVRNTLCLLQKPRSSLPTQVRDWPQEQPAGPVKGLEFHVEILSV